MLSLNAGEALDDCLLFEEDELISVDIDEPSRVILYDEHNALATDNIILKGQRLFEGLKAAPSSRPRAPHSQYQ